MLLITTGGVKPIRVLVTTYSGQQRSLWTFPTFTPLLSMLLYYLNVKTLLALSKPTKSLVFKVTLKQIFTCLIRPTHMSFSRLLVTHVVFIPKNLKNERLKTVHDVETQKKAWVSRFLQVKGICPDSFGPTLEEIFRVTFNKRHIHLLYGTNQISPSRYVPHIKANSAISIFRVEEINNLQSGTIVFPVFKNCNVVHGSYVIQDNYFIRNVPYNISGFDSFPQTNVLVNRKEIFQQSTFKQSEHVKAIFFGSSSNWYHFLVEVLPRALLWKEQSNEVIPVIFHASAPKSIQQIIQLVGQTKPILIEDSESANVKYLTIALDARYRTQADMMSIRHGENIFQNRLKDLNLIKRWLEANFPPAEGTYSAKIFLARGQEGLRPMTNFDQVKEILEDKGFKTIYPERLTLEQQIATFSNAEFIVAEGGAGLTNLIFCENLKKVIHIEANPNWYVSNFWQQFAEILSLSSDAVLGTPESVLGYPTGGFLINVQNLLEILE